MSEQPSRPMTAEDRDDQERYDGYSARCSYWESLTDEDIWGGPRPPLQPISAPPVVAP